jgi:hypothetical protein
MNPSRARWVADAAGIDFPHVKRVARIRRDRYDAGGALVSKEIVPAVTSLKEDKAGAGSLAGIAMGQWGIESVHWVRSPRHRLRGRRQHRVQGKRPPGHGHAAESRHQPALPGRGKGR